MGIYNLNDDIIDLFKLYTYVDRLNEPLAKLLQDYPDAQQIPLEMKDNFQLYVEKSDTRHYLIVDVKREDEKFSFKVKLGKPFRPIDRRVANDVRCQLHKHLNGVHTDRYVNGLYRTMESEFLSAIRRTVSSDHKFGFTKVVTTCIDLTYPFGILIDVEITSICKFKIIRSGFDILLKRYLYGLQIDQHLLSIRGDKTDIAKSALKELRAIKALL